MKNLLVRRSQDAAPAREAAVNPTPQSKIEVQGYKIELRNSVEKRDELVIMFSSGRGFNLYKHDFERGVLFVADPNYNYYLYDAPKLARAIAGVVERGGYRRIAFLGGSKAGFAAMAIAKLCARLMRNRVFHVIAFSPQVRLHPKNKNLYFKSYKNLRRKAAGDARFEQALIAHGDQSDAGLQPNLFVCVVFARDAEVDRKEARRLEGNVWLREVAGSKHGTLFYFVCHGLSRAQIRSRIERTYRRADDRDLLQTRPEDMSAFADEIAAAALSEPRLNDFVGQVFARRPKRTIWLTKRLGDLRRRLGFDAKRGRRNARVAARS